MRKRLLTGAVAVSLMVPCLPAAAQSDAVDNTARNGVGNLNAAVQDLQARVRSLEELLAGMQAQIDAIPGAPGSKTVFITSQVFSGDLGGIAGADATCNALASAAGLAGTYKAWIAGLGGSPALYFTKESLPYRLVDGTQVAESWAGLVDQIIDHAIDLDEYGAQSAAYEVWSNTDYDGSAVYSSYVSNCRGWTDSTAGYYGGTGWVPQPGESWSYYNDRRCDDQLPFYCFEQ